MMADYVWVKAKYTYNEEYTPPRCRKARTRVVNGECEIAVPSITESEAPIAFKHREFSFPKTKTYRLYNGHLYAREIRYINTSWQIASKKEVKSHYTWLSMRHFKHYFYRLNITNPNLCHSAEECEAVCQSEANKYLIINEREIWSICNEPRYVIMTFGCGHNHASTSLMISNEFNPNIPYTRYFPANERDAAVKEAIRIALARGDTNYVMDIKKSQSIKVMIPAAVTCDPKAWGGRGDAFINMLEEMVDVAENSSEAAALVIAAALKEVVNDYN